MSHDGSQRDSPAKRPRRGLARSHAVVLLTVLAHCTLWGSCAGQDDAQSGAAVDKVRFAPPTLAQRTREDVRGDPALAGRVRVVFQTCLCVARCPPLAMAVLTFKLPPRFCHAPHSLVSEKCVEHQKADPPRFRSSQRRLPLRRSRARRKAWWLAVSLARVELLT